MTTSGTRDTWIETTSSSPQMTLRWRTSGGKACDPTFCWQRRNERMSNSILYLLGRITTSSSCQRSLNNCNLLLHEFLQGVWWTWWLHWPRIFLSGVNYVYDRSFHKEFSRRWAVGTTDMVKTESSRAFLKEFSRRRAVAESSVMNTPG